MNKVNFDFQIFRKKSFLYTRYKIRCCNLVYHITQDLSENESKSEHSFVTKFQQKQRLLLKFRNLVKLNKNFEMSNVLLLEYPIPFFNIYFLTNSNNSTHCKVQQYTMKSSFEYVYQNCKTFIFFFSVSLKFYISIVILLQLKLISCHFSIVDILKSCFPQYKSINNMLVDLEYKF